AGFLTVALSPRPVAAAFAERREVVEDSVEKKAKPGAFPPPGPPHPVESVVPVAAAHQWQSMRPDGECSVDGPEAVLEQGRRLGRHLRRSVGLLGLRGKWGSLEEAHRLLETEGIPGGV